MSGEDLEQTVHRLRGVELRHAIRGVDPGQVRRLLDEAADSLASAAREQNELRRELERLRAADDKTADKTADEKRADDKAADDKDAIANALVTATRIGEGIVAEAQEKAARITAEADARAAGLLERTASLVEERERETAAARAQLDQEFATARSSVAKEYETARAEAEVALAGARRELDRLEAEAERLRSGVGDAQRQVVEIVQAGIRKLETLRNEMDSAVAGADLLADLRPTLDPRPAQTLPAAEGQTPD